MNLCVRVMVDEQLSSKLAFILHADSDERQRNRYKREADLDWCIKDLEAAGLPE